jgi:hypothetical protein
MDCTVLQTALNVECVLLGGKCPSLLVAIVLQNVKQKEINLVADTFGTKIPKVAFNAPKVFSVVSTMFMIHAWLAPKGNINPNAGKTNV